MRRSILIALAALSAACGSKTAPPSPPCDQACRDGIALRAVRETMKYVYNRTIQGSPVGPQDAGTDAFLSGSARVSGTATADPLQGTTTVDLAYVFTNANYLQKDDMPLQNYNIVVDGTLWQNGILAVQPSATTSLLICGKNLHVSGTVYDPPLPYDTSSIDGPDRDAGEPVCVLDMTPGDSGTDRDAGESDCALNVTQSGSDVAGRFCGRVAGFHF